MFVLLNLQQHPIIPTITAPNVILTTISAIVTGSII